MYFLSGATDVHEFSLPVAATTYPPDVLPVDSGIIINMSSSPSSDPSSSISSYITPSIFNSHSSSPSEGDEVASLPSTSGSSFLEDDDNLSVSDDGSDAEREWKESLQQLELLLTMVLVPFVGKMVGRKCAYWGMF